MQAFGWFFRKKIELFYYFMHGDGFGCLHTEDISGHKIEGLPFLRKTTRRCTYAPRDAAVNSEGKFPIIDRTKWRRTHPEGEGACRNYNKKRPEGRFYTFRRNTTRCIATLTVPQEQYTAHQPACSASYFSPHTFQRYARMVFLPPA